MINNFDIGFNEFNFQLRITKKYLSILDKFKNYFVNI